MAINPEVTGGAGAILGAALMYAGRYLYIRLTANGNGNEKPQIQNPQPFICQEHHSLVKEVREGFTALHEKVNGTREDVAEIKGMLKQKRGET